ncbi:MAG: decaprenyl-phosphate phosphoribosyltransferase [Bacteroides intestinalis]|nr:decaprenyl-phosphate phosphoribosyltransferase [Bacteroides intestinalis]
MKNLILLLRPHQWLKNLFIFLPLFFGRHFTDIEYLIPCIMAFLAYSFAASSIYCFNDIWDVEADRQHPKKSKRPIASGKISQRMGYLVAVGCVVVSLLLVIWGMGTNSFLLSAIICFYLVINVLYCIKLKQVALVDVFIIAFGFVLRVFAGGVAAGIWISQWIVLMTFLLALFLAFAKRRDDVVIYEDTGLKARKNVNRYNLQFMNQAISIVASITMMCYIMYTVSEKVTERMDTSYLYVTSVFVLAGIMRYLQLTIVDVKSGSPTKVLMTDRFIQFCVFGWLISFFCNSILLSCYEKDCGF